MNFDRSESKRSKVRVGSDKERLWIWNDIFFNQFWKLTSFKSGAVLCRTRLFPRLISKLKWLGYKLPLKIVHFNSKSTFLRWFLRLDIDFPARPILVIKKVGTGESVIGVLVITCEEVEINKSMSLNLALKKFSGS